MNTFFSPKNLAAFLILVVVYTVLSALCMRAGIEDFLPRMLVSVSIVMGVRLSRALELEE